MRVKLCSENGESEQLLPPNQPDGSGIGVNYADAYLKPLNAEVETGEKVACKRKGLKIMFSYGEQKGEALMCKRTHGPDPKNILRHALVAAAQAAGFALAVEEGEIYLEATA